jgi:DNA-binding transcriptional MerR regulator
MDDEQASQKNGNRPGRASSLPPGRRSVPLARPERHRYAMAELVEETGFSARAIRFYITKGLLSPAHGRGPSATYDAGHLLRLRAIQRRQGEGMTLDEIKADLGEKSDREIADELSVRTEPEEDRWRRIILHPDIELHVRDRAGQRDYRLAKTVDLIVSLAQSAVDNMEREP